MKISAAIKAFLAISFWGASFVATKIVLRQVSPLTVIALRFGMGVLVLVVVVAARREFRWPQRGDVGWLVLLGLNGVTVHQLLQANGLMTTTATNSAWIVALTPIFSALLAWLILRESFGWIKVMGLALALIGALLVTSRGQLSGGLFSIPATPGDFLVLLSAPNWALFTVLSKRIVGRLPPALMLMYVMLVGWLAIMPLFVFSGGLSQAPHLTWAGWGGVLFLGLLCSGAAYIFWYDALDVAGASQVAAFLYIEPFVTLIVAAWLIGETIRWASLVGGAIILLGVWLVNRSAPVSVAPKVESVEGRA